MSKGETEGALPTDTTRMNSDQAAMEIARLNKIIQVLMDRAEIGLNTDNSDFSLFQTTINLEEKVRKRTAELQQALGQLAHTNEELDESLKVLKATQDQLVESKKMAALGGLVAGVAHEINTPVGVSITAASVVVSDVKEVKSLLRSGQLTQARMEQFLEMIENCGELTVSSLNRVAHMVSDFKQVAVNQQSMAKQFCDLNQTITDTCFMLQAKISQHQVTLDTQYECAITGQTYESAVAQIITNLINNALSHAFNDTDNGLIRIRTHYDGQLARITFSDNGQGIAQDVLGKIFEPFYTTKRGDGGMGLGLHITYNLVTEILNGTIACYSERGRGSRFEIGFPM